jgi:hypothetical protein
MTYEDWGKVYLRSIFNWRSSFSAKWVSIKSLFALRKIIKESRRGET